MIAPRRQPKPGAHRAQSLEVRWILDGSWVGSGCNRNNAGDQHHRAEPQKYRFRRCSASEHGTFWRSFPRLGRRWSPLSPNTAPIAMHVEHLRLICRRRCDLMQLTINPRTTGPWAAGYLGRSPLPGTEDLPPISKERDFYHRLPRRARNSVPKCRPCRR